MSVTGNISDIRHYAINDGPGIRVTVFLKGCPLTCAWCHNPESISPEREIMYLANRCILCGECVKICPQGALSILGGRVVRNRSLCTLCGACVDHCPTLALEMVGRSMSTEEVLEIIEKDRAFFEHSGGGVTFSGGEPLMQPEFLLKMLQICRERKIHTAVDTSGYGETAALLQIAEFTDLFLFDLKLMDSQSHLQWCGAEKELIHTNLRQLCASGAEILYRMPMVHGVNCDQENLEQTARLIASLPGANRTIELLPWHNVAQKKYEQLEREYRDAAYFAELGQGEMSAAARIFATHGITARV